MRRLLLSSLVACCACAGSAGAHPHVWADVRTSLMVDGQGLITGVRMEWTFDEGYSGFALEGLDTNGDGTYEPDEIKPLTDENIANLAESDYFAMMRQNNKPLPHGKVTDYTQIYENNRLTLAFVFPLETPVDPRKGVFDYKVYDPDFFISFDYVKDEPVDLEGTLPAGCTWELKPVLSDEELEAKRNFLADKGTDWVNDTGEDFGSLFARPVVVTCGS
jgi:ABC-type uncharacterized transport system substrate-binding protein